MTRDDAADLALVGGLAALAGGVAWLLWPSDAQATSHAYAPATPPLEPPVSTLPPFLAAAPPAGPARERYFEAAAEPPVWVRVPLGGGIEVDVARDYLTGQGVHLPLWPSTAQRVADRFGAMLPTKRLVDAIWRATTVKVAPRPMAYRPLAGDDVRIIAQHEAIVDGQVAGRVGLTDGGFKSIIVGRSVPSTPDKVFIYGWHRLDGTTIQPVFGGHSSRFSDYSHGTRLVSRTAYRNGQPVPIESLFADPTTATLLNESGVLPANALRYPTT